jgi:tetratricopeptide (TPR) repeat protein
MHMKISIYIYTYIGTLYNVFQDFESAIICLKEALEIKADYAVNISKIFNTLIHMYIHLHIYRYSL